MHAFRHRIDASTADHRSSMPQYPHWRLARGHYLLHGSLRLLQFALQLKRLRRQFLDLLLLDLFEVTGVRQFGISATLSWLLGLRAAVMSVKTFASPSTALCLLLLRLLCIV